MPSSYPGALDALTNPTATDAMNSVTVPHATVHSLANDAIEAVQAELGVNPAGAAATVVARLDTLDTTLGGKAATVHTHAPADVTGTAVVTGDARLSDARTPTAHAASHADGGGDEITVAESQVTGLTSALAGKSPSSCLWLSGTAGNYVSAPDAAPLDITGDLDVRMKLGLADWTPSSIQDLVGKWGVASNSSWLIRILTDGTLRLIWTADGTTQILKTSTAAVGAADGADKWIRVTLDVDNGATQNEVKFYTSDDGATWTQLGSTVTTAGVTSIFSGTSELRFGYAASSYIVGKVHRFILRSGIDGTIVADWNGRVPAVRYRDVYGNVWTVNGIANAFMEA